jgi:hypothetical protein
MTRATQRLVILTAAPPGRPGRVARHRGRRSGVGS